MAAARPHLRQTPLGRFSFRYVKNDLLYGYRQINLGQDRRRSWRGRRRPCSMSSTCAPAATSRPTSRSCAGLRGPRPGRTGQAGARRGQAQTVARGATRTRLGRGSRPFLRGAVRAHLIDLVRATDPRQGRNVAREYLQARILGILQREGAMVPLAFQGGTCLRFLFNLPRYSEDLDLRLEGDPAFYDLRRWLAAIRAQLSREVMPSASRCGTEIRFTARSCVSRASCMKRVSRPVARRASPSGSRWIPARRRAPSWRPAWCAAT